MNPGAHPSSVCVGSALFTDLVGFTEYNDAVGDVAAVQLLEKQTELATIAIDGRPNARLVKELGDGLMMWFESAAEGLGTAVALLTSVGEARAAGDFPLAVRMGIHHGEVILRGQDVVGQTINIAARVSDLAGPGELLVSDSAVAACSAAELSLQLEPIGPVVLKGVSEPVWLQRVCGLKSLSTTRALKPIRAAPPADP